MRPSFRLAIPQILEREALPVDKFGHQPRLYRLTREIGKGLAYDDDVVFAAAWLHDLGVFIGHRPEGATALKTWDHVAYACARAPEILASTDFPAEKIPAVLEAIRNHQPQDTPQSLEATILRDADILEQLGAIGILRNVSKVGRDTRYARFSEILPVLRRSLETLPGKIQLDATQALAKPRIELLTAFLAAVEAEAGNLLY
ncbi:HD domain-containing protein [Silvibacterium dinghuense]|uniref:HD domain-containing protein n=1 Tax=Silvibacterium dinghuense TaxID=1560006 RepID=A0A4Q1S884_9BACT|nr:HD domain-containing protein [Silvibacterium dinghuense]RXS93049.1 HD domain-containing protein [Silvibacterium dinghuense]